MIKDDVTEMNTVDQYDEARTPLITRNNIRHASKHERKENRKKEIWFQVLVAEIVAHI